jgi:shikimate kinase
MAPVEPNRGAEAKLFLAAGRPDQRGLALPRRSGFAASMSEPGVNLYLVGFMGTGKTTVGRAAAMRLGFQVMDSDHEVERMKGQTVAQIFAGEGEGTFRALERKFIESGHPARGVVVACGGGLVVPAGMLELLRTKGVVVCLHASLDTILRRTAQARTRPLLEVENPAARIRQLYAEREEIYKRAGTVILTDFRPLHDIVMHVLRTYRREAREWERAHVGAPPREEPHPPAPAAPRGGPVAGGGPTHR